MRVRVSFFATLSRLAAFLPPDTENVLNDQANPVGHPALLFIIGLAFDAAARRRRVASSGDGER